MHSKLHVTYISINDAVEYSSNARTHDRSQIQQIARSIQEFGFLVPVLLDENNVVIAGHGRILAAWELGLEAIPAIQANHLIPNQTRAYRNADNKLTENAGWDEGIAQMHNQESRGFEELTRIFGKPVSTLGRHGGSYGPQLVAALANMGAGFVYSPVRLPGHNAVWFCNTLNFYGSYGGFDDNYYRDDLFDPMLENLGQRFPADIHDVDVLTFFACHPCKIRTVQFWDLNYYKGANPGPELWKMPELRPAETMETARKNFRRLMRFLKDRKDIEIATFGDVISRFSHQKESITQAKLAEIASRILKEKKVVIDDHFNEWAFS